MANPYRALFSAPGTLAFTSAGFLGRLALPMTGIGIITMLAQLNGSYGLAGAVSASFVFSYAVISPQTSRFVDKFGQSKVIPVTLAISLVGLLSLMLSSHLNLPSWMLFVSAALAGFMPSMAAMTRARWTAIYRGRSELQTAYSLETVLDEFTFIAGPPISVGLSVTAFPQAGLLIATCVLALGVLLFVAQRRTEPPLDQTSRALEAGSIVRNPGVLILVTLLLAMGIVVGTVDIVSVAFAKERGYPAAASAVLSAYAIGSCVAGLMFGAAKLSVSLTRLLLFGGLATAAATIPLLLVANIPGLIAAVFVAGLFFAPTMIIAMSLVEQMVPEAKLTEGLTWLLAGLNTGTAIGAALSGQIVDTHGTTSGFGVALAAGLLIVTSAVWGSSMLRSRLA